MKILHRLSRCLGPITLLLVSMLPVACQSIPPQQGTLNPPAQGANIRVSGKATGGSGTTNTYRGQGLTLRYTSSDGAFALSAPVSHLRVGNIASAFSALIAGDPPIPAPAVSASTLDRLDGTINVPNRTPCNVEMSSKVQVALQNDGTASLQQRITLGPPSMLGQSHTVRFAFRVKSGDPSKIEVRKNSSLLAQFPNGSTYVARYVTTCTLDGSNIVAFRIDTGANVPAGGGGLAFIAADTFYNITR